MRTELETVTMNPAYRRAERLVKAFKGLRKKFALESALITRYHGDEFLDSTPVPLTEVGSRIRGYIYQSFDVNLSVTGSILDVVVSKDPSQI
jgi:hypothetical protein